ncbi:MAG TPA: tRNA-binding protein [Actinomycetota bacterium]|nr:tRNA-binding protein [Actinomycetota bacterium]
MTEDARPYAPEKLPRKPDVTPDDFFAVDIRAGRIVKVEDFPEARKPAYKITADFGPVIGELTTSAQATNYPMEALEGRMIVAAINLGEKRIAGFKSQFLTLGSYSPEGKVLLLGLEDEAEPGAPIG